jgi:pyruvate kinase
MTLPLRRAKIVATIGPASSDSQTVENLIKAGVNVFRFNFSHGSHDDHKKRYETVRSAATKLKKNIAILQDLQGPKLRVGKFQGGSLSIEKGQDVLFVLENRETISTKTGAKPVIPYNYENLSSEILVGHRILIDDGNIEVVVTGIKGTDISAQVVFGGTLKDHKGMNFPDTKIRIDSFTPKDRQDLLFGLTLGFDYVALSFVRSAEDIKNVKKFMHKHKKNIPIVAKIEMNEAIEAFPDILAVTDAVMVARGDLAVEVGTALVPILQKKIIQACNQHGTPVITATQMLESMISAPRPTRAEASDVANAIMDGSDAVMLSAESASGKFPVLAVSTMHNIIIETEQQAKQWFKNNPSQRPSLSPFEEPNLVEAIEFSAAQLAQSLHAKAIVCTTHTGHAARALAKNRPQVPIIAMTDDAEVERRLALVWGIQTYFVDHNDSVDALFEKAEDTLLRWKMAEKDDLVVMTAGWPPLRYGTTSLLRVVTIKKSQEEVLSPEKKGKKNTQDQVLGYRTKKAQFALDQALCIQCGGCVEVCPNDIFGISNRKVYLKEQNCKNCTFDNACMEICPTSAIEVMKLSD